MDNNQPLQLANEFDVITARVHARELARREGFGITDQARISLAISSLAHKLGLGFSHRGQVEMQCQRRDQRVAMRICIIMEDTPDLDPIINNLERLRWMFMVDELEAERYGGVAKITAVKWSDSNHP